jgi:nucleoside-diphosphate-sugar epimerase
MKKNLSNTIIGSGFIAKSFYSHLDKLKKLNICLYAAGVSNSQSSNNQLLEKDKNRIIDFSKTHDQTKKLVYISTCSAEDPSRNQNPYVKNKLYIEKILSNSFDNFLIIRFPEVVGKNSNNTTLINFFYNNIKSKKKFEIWTKAKRNIIDIEDAVFLTLNFLENSNLNNTTINIANPFSYNVQDIVKNIESLINIKASYKLIDAGSDDWNIDISKISETIKNNKNIFGKNYLYKILKKYYF